MLRWLRVRAPGSAGYNATREIVKSHGLVTVCEEAACPNIGECWEQRTATIMIQTSDTGISSFQPIAMNWS